MEDATPASVLHHVPIDDIDMDALTRDRVVVFHEPLEQLKRSIRTLGIQCPLLLFRLPDAPETAAGAEPLDPDATAEGTAPPAPAEATTPPGDTETPSKKPRYGLIAGYRRLAAAQWLFDEGNRAFATVPALIREVADTAHAYRLMVEENAQRADVSPWEQGRLLRQAVNKGVFRTVEEAAEELHQTASRHTQARLRRVADLSFDLEAYLEAPETLSLRQLLRIADAADAGFLDPIQTALWATKGQGGAAQWAAVVPYLDEHRAEAAAIDAGTAPPTRPGRPRRAAHLHYTLDVRREKTRDGYVLRFSGKDATGPLLDEVLDRIVELYKPRRQARTWG